MIGPLPRYEQDAYHQKADRLKDLERTLPYKPSKRGFGPGWPNCDLAHIHKHPVNRIGVRCTDDIAELMTLLVKMSNALDYDIRPRYEPSGGIGGFDCRPVRNTGKPSFHSFGISLDQNSSAQLCRPFFRSVTPPDVVLLWESAGWEWLGRGFKIDGVDWYDPMHFGYRGARKDIPDDINNAIAAFDALTGGGQLYEPLWFTNPDNKRTMIRVLHFRLAEHGYPLTQPEGDDTFTMATSFTVKQFQRAKGLVVDGIVGAVTWPKLLADPTTDETQEPEMED
jgi:peptidoglycan hydrolase-like protein with peptidoglycan-binding domain